MFYKETGFIKAEPWVPKGWTNLELGQIIESVKGRNPSVLMEEQLEGYLPYLSAGYLRGNERTKFMEPSSESILVDDGELILLWDGANAGEFFSGKKGVLSSTMAKLKPKDKAISQRYLFYLLKSKETFLRSQTRGTGIPHVDRAVFRRLSISLAPVQEQYKIAEILSCVDLAIQKTDEVIAQTDRLKKGLIQKLLAEGIGHKEFKDTEIGKIPNDWEVVMLEKVATKEKNSFVDGPFGSVLRVKDYVEHGIRIIRLKNIGEGCFVDDYKRYISEEKSNELKKYVAYPGDIVIFEMADPIARACIVPDIEKKFVITAKSVRLRVGRDFDPNFLVYAINSLVVRNQAISQTAGSTRPMVTLLGIRKLKIPSPTISEQRKIVGILLTVDSKLDLERKQKSKLERIRQGLMDLLFTGKVRVKVD